MTRTAVVGALAVGVAAGFAIGRLAPSDDAATVRQTTSPPVADLGDHPSRADAATDVAGPNAERGARDPDPKSGRRAEAGTSARVTPAPDDLRDAIARAFVEKRPQASPPTREELNALGRRAEDAVAALRRSYEEGPKTAADAMAAHLAERDAARVRIGVLAGEAEILLQARGRASADAAGGVGAGATRSAAAIDVAAAPERNAPPRHQTFLRGGLVPYGSVFVIERAEATIVLEAGDLGESAALVPHAPLLVARGGPRRLHAVFSGAWRVGAGEESDVALRAESAGIEMRLSGRVVPVADAPPEQPLEWQEEGAEGYLRDVAPVRLQVRAGHGGGNPNSVDLAGLPNGHVSGVSPTAVWDDASKPETNGASLVWREGAGQIPPGRVLRVKRIDWRTRLGPGASFVLRVGDDPPVKRAGKDAPADSGLWQGDLVLRPGEESRISLTCAYFGFAEAVIYGRLERP